MQLYSQHDPAYANLTLKDTNLTIHGYGCFLCSIATLYQISPIDLLKVSGAFNDAGLLFAETLAQSQGGEYQGTVSGGGPGWYIAMTDHYANLGFPTHFFCVNPGTMQQIDPLKFPAVVEPLSYSIKEYRKFTNIKLDLSPAPQQTNVARVSQLRRALTHAAPALALRIKQLLKTLTGA